MFSPGRCRRRPSGNPSDGSGQGAFCRPNPRRGGQSEPYLSWAIFMTLVVCGVGTILQSLQIKRFGAGHLVIMSVHPAHVPICIMALLTGGPALMLSLIVVSSLFQILLTPYMSLLRRIITPAVSGTLLMLVAAISIPPIFGLLENTSPLRLRLPTPR